MGVLSSGIDDSISLPALPDGPVDVAGKTDSIAVFKASRASSRFEIFTV